MNISTDILEKIFGRPKIDENSWKYTDFFKKSVKFWRISAVTSDFF